MTFQTFKDLFRGLVLAGFGMFVVLGISIETHAATINVIDFSSPATVDNCTLNGGGDHALLYPTLQADNCASTALYPTLADVSSTFIAGNFDGQPPTTETFTDAFNNWNASHGNQWTLVDGGDLDVTFSVTDVATANQSTGGINPFQIDVNYVPHAGDPTIDQLVWTQAVYSSFDTAGDVDSLFLTLDTFSTEGQTQPCEAIPGQTPGPFNSSPSTIGPSTPGQGYCDPLYPFQYADKQFFDRPQGPWPDESFRAIALLSDVTFFTDETGEIYKRELRVYDGVNWGFDLSVPEPPAGVMLIAGLIAFFGIIRMKRRDTVSP